MSVFLSIMQWIGAALLVPVLGGLVWLGQVSQKVDDNADDITEVKDGIKELDRKLTQILLLLAKNEYGSR